VASERVPALGCFWQSPGRHLPLQPSRAFRVKRTKVRTFFNKNIRADRSSGPACCSGSGSSVSRARGFFRGPLRGKELRDRRSSMSRSVGPSPIAESESASITKLVYSAYRFLVRSLNRKPEARSQWPLIRIPRTEIGAEQRRIERLWSSLTADRTDSYNAEHGISDRAMVCERRLRR
jgi:hypothetical protein